MSSIVLQKNKSRYIQLSPGEVPAIANKTQRPKISLGKVTHKQAQTAQVHIENLCRANKTATAIPDTTASWLESLGSSIRVRLEQLGLVEPSVKKASYTIHEWIDRFISTRGDVKASTLICYNNAKRNLLDFLNPNTHLDDITAQETREFKAWLVSNQKLSENTARKRCSISKQFFAAAKRARIITENPFDGISCAVRANPSRFYYVTDEEAQAVMEACPDVQWRVIFALCRWGGLRCPSEVLRLKWEDINWDAKKITVHASKTEHLANGGIRILPLFPELESVLLEAFSQAEAGKSQYVITRYRQGQNLGALLRKIVLKAGLKPWPKLCQNLRSTRETELFKLTGGNIKAVCDWIGNSPMVAMKHYAQVTEEDFTDVLKASPAPEMREQNWVHKGSKSGCRTQPQDIAKSRKLRMLALILANIHAGENDIVQEFATWCKNQPMGLIGLNRCAVGVSIAGDTV